MSTPDPAHPDAFPLTRHAVVRAIAAADIAVRSAAFETIVGAYWRPAYAYSRLRWHRDAEDAKDLTQEFFARALEKEYLARYDPSKARFRTFLRTCLDGFVANADQHARRLKRGGAYRMESLDFDRAEEDARSSAERDLRRNRDERDAHDAFERAPRAAAAQGGGQRAARGGP
jgi:DNA-directed RNA polymerase specialized sigma24 family protein